MGRRRHALGWDKFERKRDALRACVRWRERGNARLLFIVDVEIGGRGDNGAPLAGIPVAKLWRL
jgi:hypothetical protein